MVATFMVLVNIFLVSNGADAVVTCIAWTCWVMAFLACASVRQITVMLGPMLPYFHVSILIFCGMTCHKINGVV